MEARSLQPQRAPGGHTGLDGPLELDYPRLRQRLAVWRRATTLAALIAAPWVVIGGAVVATLHLL